MRALAILAVLFVTAYATADRLIEIPIGRKIEKGLVRGEAIFDAGKTGRNRFLLGAGLTTDFDAEFMLDNLDTGGSIFTFDVGYRKAVGFIDQSPGVMLGVKDALDRTPERRRFYVAVTQKVGTDTDVPLEVTIGAATNSRHPVFVGASVPFGEKVHLLAEHDSRKVTLGVELRPIQGVALRALFQPDRTLLSVSLTRRF
jgi:hypothetical protein